MHDTQMSCERIVSTESFLRGTQLTPKYLLEYVMYSVFVSHQVITFVENDIARFASTCVEPFALIGRRLTVVVVVVLDILID